MVHLDVFKLDCCRVVAVALAFSRVVGLGAVASCW